jgi:peptide/nickel transport system permease protein
LAALKKGSPVDLLSRTVMQIGGAVPSFWLAMLFMLLFSSYLGWFPVTGYTAPGENFGAFLKCIALPSLVLAIGELGILIRIVRSSMLTALQQDFMMSANVKGLPPARAIVHYALRSAIIAPITISGMQLAKLLGGTVIVETIFALPGIGRLMLTAVEQRDIILLQGIVLFITSMVVLVSLVTDLAVMAANPTIRTGEETVQG